MAKDIQLKKAERDLFPDQGSSWMALDLPEVKPPFYSKAFIVFLTGFLCSAVIYSAVTKVPVAVESAGKLVTAKPAIPVRANFDFTVNNLRVKENQIVKVDELLVTSDKGFSPEELALIDNLESNLDFLNQHQMVTQCDECASVARQISNTAKQLSKHRVAGGVMKQLAFAGDNLASRLDKFKEINQKFEPLRTRLASLAQTSSRAPASVAQANIKEAQKMKAQMEQTLKPFAEVLQKDRNNFAESIKRAAMLVGELSRMSGVKAPVEGKIVNIRLKGAGEMVGNGQPVMEIIPTDNQIVANLDVMNRDIGSVKVGDAVEIAVDAYPEADYGVLKGEIAEILPTDGSEAPNPFMPGGDRGFRVRVHLASQEFHSGNSSYPLLPGMTIRARAIKQKETLLKKFYRSLFRVKEDERMRRI